MIFPCMYSSHFMYRILYSREDQIKPLPGDNVEISPVQDEEKQAGNVNAILPRKNVLIRPAVANVDQALVVFAAASPKPNLNLLDRFLISMEQQRIPVVICFNKTDLISTKRRSCCAIRMCTAIRYS